MTTSIIDIINVTTDHYMDHYGDITFYITSIITISNIQ